MEWAFLLVLVFGFGAVVGALNDIKRMLEFRINRIEERQQNLVNELFIWRMKWDQRHRDR